MKQFDDENNVGISEPLIVEKHYKNQNRTRFDGDLFPIGEKVHVLTTKAFEKLQKQVENTGNQNNNLEITKLNEQITSKDTTIANLQKDLQTSISEKDAIIDDLKAELLEYKNQCNNLKETIGNYETDIYEKDNIIKELTPYKDYIAPKQHYDELTALKDTFAVEKEDLQQQLADKEKEIEQQEKELKVSFADEISDLKSTFADDKAQLLVAYNNNINHYKIKYNNLANKYNALYDDVSSLSRLNTMFNGRHKEIIEDKEVVELEIVEKDNTQNTTIELNEGLQN